jgi:hypothetical protein
MRPPAPPAAPAAVIVLGGLTETVKPAAARGKR